MVVHLRARCDQHVHDVLDQEDLHQGRAVEVGEGAFDVEGAGGGARGRRRAMGAVAHGRLERADLALELARVVVLGLGLAQPAPGQPQLGEVAGQLRVVRQAHRRQPQRRRAPAFDPAQHQPRVVGGDGRPDRELGQWQAVRGRGGPGLDRPERRLVIFEDVEPRVAGGEQRRPAPGRRRTERRGPPAGDLHQIGAAGARAPGAGEVPAGGGRIADGQRDLTGQQIGRGDLDEPVRPGVVGDVRELGQQPPRPLARRDASAGDRQPGEGRAALVPLAPVQAQRIRGVATGQVRSAGRQRGVGGPDQRVRPVGGGRSGAPQQLDGVLGAVQRVAGHPRREQRLGPGPEQLGRQRAGDREPLGGDVVVPERVGRAALQDGDEAAVLTRQRRLEGVLVVAEQLFDAHERRVGPRGVADLDRGHRQVELGPGLPGRVARAVQRADRLPQLAGGVDRAAELAEQRAATHADARRVDPRHLPQRGVEQVEGLAAAPGHDEGDGERRRDVGLAGGPDRRRVDQRTFQVPEPGPDVAEFAQRDAGGLPRVGALLAVARGEQLLGPGQGLSRAGKRERGQARSRLPEGDLFVPNVTILCHARSVVAMPAQLGARRMSDEHEVVRAARERMVPEIKAALAVADFPIRVWPPDWEEREAISYFYGPGSVLTRDADAQRVAEALRSICPRRSTTGPAGDHRLPHAGRHPVPGPRARTHGVEGRPDPGHRRRTRGQARAGRREPRARVRAHAVVALPGDRAGGSRAARHDGPRPLPVAAAEQRRRRPGGAHLGRRHRAASTASRAGRRGWPASPTTPRTTSRIRTPTTSRPTPARPTGSPTPTPGTARSSPG